MRTSKECETINTQQRRQQSKDFTSVMATIEMKKPFNLPFNGFDE